MSLVIKIVVGVIAWLTIVSLVCLFLQGASDADK